MNCTGKRLLQKERTQRELISLQSEVCSSTASFPRTDTPRVKNIFILLSFHPCCVLPLASLGTSHRCKVAQGCIFHFVGTGVSHVCHISFICRSGIQQCTQLCHLVVLVLPDNIKGSHCNTNLLSTCKSLILYSCKNHHQKETFRL